MPTVWTPIQNGQTVTWVNDSSAVVLWTNTLGLTVAWTSNSTPVWTPVNTT